MRKTKIICTIGPASESEATLEAMCLAGMNVARLNFSHGTHEEALVKITRIKAVREKLGLPIAILLDTKGPEYRIRTFKNGSVTVPDGAPFTFCTDEVVGDETQVTVSYRDLDKELEPGDRVLVNNGLLIFEVTSVEPGKVHCTTLAGGVMSDRKSMAFPNKVLHSVYLSEQDKSDLLFGIAHDVDFVACSFVSCAQDLRDVKAFLDANGGSGISLIAKIENRTGVDNIEEISKECDGIMIGRGDMGVEIPFEQLPAIQKKLITKCRLLGKRVITATEMLESMIQNPRPTRAEISDVANAVYDGTSAVMLSGETAAGKYPVETIKAMAKICVEAENAINYKRWFRDSAFKIQNTVDAISHATCGMAIDIGAKAIVACSLSGATARMISRFRPPVDIIGLTVNERTYRQLALSWGVIPAMCDIFQSVDVLFYTGAKVAQRELSLEKGDRIVITGGLINGTSGNTSLIKVETI
ncbi:MAG: pyruvate kinase [Clostridia bacterium]|nr:pyruvate kinase [Clostridia bacterium]MBR3553790.1 pyruvate kinase [Clostridia bacterium]